MMQEVYELKPGEGKGYTTAKDAGEAAGPPPPLPEGELVHLTLEELHGFTGKDNGRILFSLSKELLDVTAGRELYGPGGSYSLFAGRDVTRCLATMSLEPEALDDLRWEPACAEDESAVKQWREKLKAKYPVAGTLRATPQADRASAAEGLRQRAVPATAAKVVEGA